MSKQFMGEEWHSQMALWVTTLAVFVAFACFPACAWAGTWRGSGDRLWYQEDDGSYPSGTSTYIDGEWYSFDGDGWLRVGWVRDRAPWGDWEWYWYHDRHDGRFGAQDTGWVQTGGYWYWLDEDSGVMCEGWLDASVSGSGGSRACLEYLAYDFDYQNDDYYLHDADTARADGVPEGSMAGSRGAGWARTPDPETGGYAWCYFEGGGRLHQGWVHTGGRWYYMPDREGRWVHDRIGYGGRMLDVDGKTYSFDGDGAMQVGWVYQTPDGDARHYAWHYYGPDGAMLFGWQRIGRDWYYLGPTGEMVHDAWVDGYYLSSSGAMA